MTTKSSGFSLVELLVVIAIIGVLSAVGTITYQGYISGTKKKTAKGVAGDIVAEDLLQAQNSLSEITGEFTNEELLDSIFNRFCIGK